MAGALALASSPHRKQSSNFWAGGIADSVAFFLLQIWRHAAPVHTTNPSVIPPISTIDFLPRLLAIPSEMVSVQATTLRRVA